MNFYSLLSYLLIYVSVAYPTVFKISTYPEIDIIEDKAGSMLGGTRLRIRGAGFDISELGNQNQVLVGDKSCEIVNYYTSQQYIECLTPSMEEISTSLQVPISVMVNYRDTIINSGAYPSFAYSWENTPVVYHITPFQAPPGYPIAFYGRWLAGDTSHLSEFKVGRKRIAQEDLNEFISYNSTGVFNVTGYLGDNISGDTSVLARIDGNFGLANFRWTASSYDLDGTEYKFKTIPLVESISSKSGSPEGGHLLTITGAGFPLDKAKINVKVGNAECSVRTVNYSKITCQTSKLVSTPVAPFIGGSGLRRNIWNQQTGSIDAIANLIGTTNKRIINDVIPVPDMPLLIGEYIRTRMWGYFRAPRYGNYTFYIASDDSAKIFLSTDHTSTKKVQIIYLNGATSYREMFDKSTLKSSPILLLQDNYYYLEIWHLQNAGEVNFNLGVEIPGLDSTVSPYPVPRVQKLTIGTKSAIRREKQYIKISYDKIGQIMLRYGDLYTSYIDRTPISTYYYWNSTVINSKITEASFPNIVSSYTVNTTTKEITYTFTFNYPWTDVRKEIWMYLILSDGTIEIYKPIASMKVTPTYPIIGSFKFSLNGAVTSALSIGASADELKEAISITVPKYREKFMVKGSTDADGGTYTFTLHGNMPEIIFVSYVKTTITTSITTNTPTNLFYWVIPSEFLYTAEDKPQVIVTANNLRAMCSGDCSYTYLAKESLPTITAFTEGDTLRFEGSNLPTTDVTVTIGHAECTIVLATAYVIVCTKPQPEAGYHTPVVKSSSIGTIPYSSSIDPAPRIYYNLAVSSVSPSQGSIAEGLILNITGTGFPPYLTDDLTLNVLIGDSICRVIDSLATQIRCVAEQSYDSTILTIKVGSFTYSDDKIFSNILATSPTVTSYTPIQASTNTKTTITINGTGFLSDKTKLKVTIGSEECIIITSTENEIVCELLGGPRGTYNFIIDVQGKGSVLVTNSFSLKFELTEVTPNIGSILGGTLLKIKGSGFSLILSQNIIEIGKKYRCIIEEVIDSNTLTCRTPSIENEKSAAEINYDVYMLNRKYEESDRCNECKFLYSASGTPTVISISPLRGVSGDTVIITGSGFSNSLEGIIVKLGVECKVNSVSDTSIVLTLPDHSAGQVNLEIIIDSTGKANTTGIFFTYDILFESLIPNQGSQAGTIVTVSGRGFSDQCSVKFSDVLCTILNVTTTVLKCITANYLKNEDSQLLRIQCVDQSFECTDTSKCGFRFMTSLTPVISKISYDSTKDLVTISGSRFEADISSTVNIVTIGNALCKVTEANSTQIKCTPSGESTSKSVKVYVKDKGYASGTFNRFIPLKISSISTTAGSFIGGNTITLTGKGLGPDTQVTICGQTCKKLSAKFDSYDCEVPGLPSIYSQANYKIIPEDSILTEVTYISSQEESGFPISRIYDNNQDTYFKSTVVDGCYIGIDAGEGWTIQLYSFMIIPLIDTNQRYIDLKGGKVQGSDDNSIWADLYTIDGPFEGMNSWTVPQNKIEGDNYPVFRYRYYRYLGTINCYISEMQFRGAKLLNSNTSTHQCQIIAKVNSVEALYETYYTYDSTKTPKLTSISPKFGTTAGNYNIQFTIDGMALDPTKLSVKIDDVDCSGISVADNKLTCKAGARTNYVSPSLTITQSDVGKVAIQGLTFLYAERWSEQNTWIGTIPIQKQESLIIPYGKTLVIDQETPILNDIKVEGILMIEDKPYNGPVLQAYNIVIYGGRLIVGTEEKPFQNNCEIIIHGRRADSEITKYGNKVIAVMNGILDLHGVERVPAWTMLDTTADAGFIKITVQDNIDWKTGDQIVIASTSFDHKEAEVRTIVSVSGKSITLDKPLLYSHYASTDTYGDDTIDMRAEIGLLTRNIRIHGVDEYPEEEHGVHIMITSTDNQSSIARLENIEVYNAGQAFSLGKYPIHFFKSGQASKSYIRNNSIHHTYNRAYGINGVHDLRVINNLAYHTKGHAFFIEQGIETDNIIMHNLGISTLQSWSLLNTDLSPSTFWISSIDNQFINNHSAGGDRYGFWFDPPNNLAGSYFSSLICPKGVKLGKFEGNTAHSYKRYGLRLYRGHVPRQSSCNAVKDDSLSDPWSFNPSIQAVYKDFTAWRNQRNGAYGYEIGDVVFEGFKLAENIIAGIEITYLAQSKPYETTKIKNAVIIGKLSTQNIKRRFLITQYNFSGSIGLITPQTDGLYSEDLRFYNFDDTMFAIGDGSLSSHKNYQDFGGRLSKFKNLKFSNSHKRIHWEFPNTGIFEFIDNSMTGTANAFLGSYNPHLLTSECNYKQTDYNSIVCNGTTKIRRINFYDNIPFSSFLNKNIIITQQANSAAPSTINMRTNTGGVIPNKSWSIPFVLGYRYNVYWNSSPIMWNGFTAEFEQFQSGDFVGLYFNQTDVVKSYQVKRGKVPEGSDVNVSDYVDPTILTRIEVKELEANDPAGSYKFSNSTDKYFELAVTGKSANTVQTGDVIVTATRCGTLTPRCCETACKQIANFNFNAIEGVVTDTISNYKLISGPTSQFYPSYESGDVYPSYNKGYYFDGSSSYMTLHSDLNSYKPIPLGSYFSIAIWIRHQTTNRQSILRKALDDNEILVLGIENNSPFLDILLRNQDSYSKVSFPANFNMISDHWHHIALTVNYTSDLTEVRFVIDDTALAATKVQGIYEESFEHIFGLSIQPLSRFQGFIYSLQIFNYPLDIYEIFRMFKTTCTGSCSICPSTHCLSLCKLTEFESNGICIACKSECTKGCVNDTSCSLCSIPLCDTCKDYGNEGCTACSKNFSLKKDGSCGCAAGYFRDYENEYCSACAGFCNSCTNSRLGGCTSCLVGFKLVDGACLSECPLGFKEVNGICTKPEKIASRFTFSAVNKLIKDSQNPSINLNKGGVSPIPMHKRGYYFNNGYLYGSVSNILLGPSFSISASIFTYNEATSSIVSRPNIGLIQLIPFIRYSNQNVPVFSCSNPLPVKVWSHLLFSVENNADFMTITCYIDGSLSGYSSFPSTYSDSSDSAIYFGSLNTTSEFFEGYIYELTIYNQPLSGIQALELEYSTECSDCTRCPKSLGDCLSSCGINNVPDTSCSPCNSSCSNGCRNNENCVLCYDKLCVECDNFDQGTCLVCQPNSILINSGCECIGSTYYDIASNSCKECSSVCKECTGPTIKECIQCADTAFKYDSFCYSQCPFGSVQSGTECIQDVTAKLSLILNRLTTDITDTIGSTYITGSSAQIFDYLTDFSDPIPAYNRGYYFKGQQFIKSNLPVKTLGHKFSMSFIIKPESEGIIYTRANEIQNYFMLSIVTTISETKAETKVETKAEIQFKDYFNNLHLLRSKDSIFLNDWTVLSFAIDFDGTDSTVSLFYNGNLTGSMTLNKSWYYEDSNLNLSIGGNYVGYIYSQCIYSTPFTLTTAKDISFSTCFDCSLGVLIQGCLNQCSNEKTPQDCTTNCPSSCTSTGCVRSENCYLCKHERCAKCIDFETSDCLECIPNASGTPCECQIGFYWNSIAKNCSICYNGCNACIGAQKDACLNCSAGFYLYYNTCIENCPVGYTSNSSTNQCELLQAPFAIWNFNLIQNTIYDSINNLPANSGSTPLFYPDYDSNDPKATYKRGYYFDGQDDILHLNPTQLHISHSVSIWFRPQSLSDSVLLSKITSYYSPIWQLKLSQLILQFDIMLGDTFESLLINRSLSIGEWYHIAITCHHINFQSILTSFLNGQEVSSLSLSNSTFIDTSNAFTVGCTTTNDGVSQCFNGYIFQISLYNNHLNSTDLYREISTVCTEGTCSICPNGYGKCLSKCDRFEGVSDTGDCLKCLDKCSEGCRDDKRCNLCKDQECRTCTNYDSGCQECIQNAQKYEEECECTRLKFSYDEREEVCKGCIEGCEKCIGPEYWQCLECKSNKELYLYLFKGICLANCPNGYTFDSSLPNTCQGTDLEIASFTFNKIEGIVSDTINSLEILTGETSAFYPDYELSDPMASSNRGYYFDGIQSYMNLTSSSILLPPSFTISLWIRPESIHLQSILTKSKDSETPSLLLAIDNLSPRIDFDRTTHISQDRVSYRFSNTLQLHTWHHLVYILSHRNQVSELISNIDNIQTSTLLGPGYYLDSPLLKFLLGHNNSVADFFSGFIYSVRVFNSALDAMHIRQMVQTDCSGGCGVCPMGICLSKCGFDEFEVEGICFECPERCELGCSESKKCNLCTDPLCKVCSDYTQNSCISCIDFASFNTENECSCLVGYYWSSDTETCRACHANCESCSGFGISDCILCKEDYYRAPNQICTDTCPLNYLADSTLRLCTPQGTPGLILSYKFNSFSGTQVDSSSGVTMEFGSSKSYYPDYDENDPYTIPDKGLYISNNKYAKISNVLLGSSFTMQLWIKATTQNTQEIFIQKTDGISTTPAFGLYITSSGTYKATYIINHTITDHPQSLSVETLNKPLRFLQTVNQWNRLTVTLSYNYPSITASIIRDKDLPVSSTLENYYFKDSTSYAIILGNSQLNSTFTGFIQNLKVYNTAITYEQSISDFPKDCKCSACTEDECISKCDLNQIEVNEKCENCLSTCKYGCMRTTDCSFNEDVLCREYTGVKYSDCEKCVPNANKTEIGCTCIMNSSYSAELDQCVCNDSYWMMDNECILCDRWLQSSEVSAYFDEYYLNVVYEFSIEVNTQGIGCKELFTAETLDKLGQGYVCEFVNNKKFRIKLGTGATIIQEDTLINRGVLKALNSECNFSKLDLKVTIKYVYSSPAPKAQFDTIENHYIDCGNLFLSGSKSSGGLYRPLHYKWTVSSDPVISSIQKYSSSDYSDKDTLTIPSQDLKASRLIITLSVRNFLEMTGTITQSTSLFEGKGITVLFDSSILTGIFRHETRSYTPRPVGECEISNSLEYSWKYLGISGNYTELDSEYLMGSQKNQKIFVVPPNTLPAGSKVKIRVNIVDTETKASGFGNLEIPVKLSPLVVGFNVSSGEIGFEQKITISADRTYDPDNINSFTYDWNCTSILGDCTDAILDTDSSTLEVLPKSLTLGIEYEFIMKVTKLIPASTSNRLSRMLQSDAIVTEKSIKLFVREGKVPVANIVMYGDDPNIPPYLPANNQLQLQLVIKDEEGPYTFSWEKIQGGSVKFSSPLNGKLLVISGGSMEAGMHYIFEVSLNNGKSTYKYKVDVYTNAPPKYGKLVSNPNSGYEYNTIFELAGTDWVDEDNHYPLQYGFGFIADGEDKTLNSKNSTNVYYTKLPYVNSPTIIFLYVFDALESYTRAESTIDLKLSENLDTRLVLDTFSDQLKDPRTSPLEVIGIANLLAVSSINRDFYLTGTYPVKTAEEVSMIHEAFNLAIDALSNMLSSMDYQSVQSLYGSVSLLNSLTDSPYLKNDTDSRNIVLDLLTSTITLAYQNNVLEDQLVNNALSTDEQTISLDSYTISSDQAAFSDVVSTSEYTIGSKALTMAPSQSFEGSTDNKEYKLSVTNSEDLGSLEMSLPNNTTEVKLPSTFSEDINVMYGEFDNIGVLLMDINIMPINQTELNPSVLVISVFNTSAGIPTRMDLKLRDPVEITIPVKNMPEDWNASCVYLNETTFKWQTDGCELLAILSDSVICACTHFSVFSVEEGIEAGGSTFEDSNIGMTVNADALNDINWETNAIGLYFCLAVLTIYIILGIILCKLDRRDHHRSLIKSLTSWSLIRQETVLTPKTANPLEMADALSDEVIPKVHYNNPSSHNHYQNQSESDEVYHFISEEIIAVQQSIRSDASNSENLPKLHNTSIKKHWWTQYKEKHEFLNLCFHHDTSMTRFSRLTLILINFLGSMFFIGMFYDSNSKTDDSEDEQSFEESIKQFSWKDFWIIIYSTGIMTVVTIIIEKLLVIKPVKLKATEAKIAKISKKNKILNILGYVVSFLLLGYFVWSIILYSIQFNIKASNMWVISTSMSFFWENIVGQTYKIAIKMYLLVIVIRWKSKRKEKKLKEKQATIAKEEAARIANENLKSKEEINSDRYQGSGIIDIQNIDTEYNTEYGTSNRKKRKERRTRKTAYTDKLDVDIKEENVEMPDIEQVDQMQEKSPERLENDEKDLVDSTQREEVKLNDIEFELLEVLEQEKLKPHKKNSKRSHKKKKQQGN